jgi:hypothetical protein
MSIKITNTGVAFNDATIQPSEYNNTELRQIMTYPPTADEQRNNSVAGSYTWTKPAGCTKVRVICVGGGGGACGHGESGGAGGYAEKWIDVTSVSTVAVTIGGAGSGTSYHSGSGDGGTSSFGSYVSASGGYGANKNASHSGGHSGRGSGGDVNFASGGGSGHVDASGSAGSGGASFFGGSKFPGWPSTSYAHTGESHYAARGAGGSGERTTHSRGSHGAAGIVIVYCYGYDPSTEASN